MPTMDAKRPPGGGQFLPRAPWGAERILPADEPQEHGGAGMPGVFGGEEEAAGLCRRAAGWRRVGF